MPVRTYYGIERVTVPGPNGERLAGTVSGVAGGRVVVGLDEPSMQYPINGGEASGGELVPGSIAQVLETELEFFVDGSEASAPSFTPEQLAYLKRSGFMADEVAETVTAQATPTPAADVRDDDEAAAAAEAAKEAAKASGKTGLSKEKLALAKDPEA